MNPRRIVIKIGTSTVTGGSQRPDPASLIELVRQVAALHARGDQLAIVSSGAIAAGRERMDFPALPKDIPAKQMLAAIGQPHLMATYEQLFGIYRLVTAQVLLTRADLALRRRYLNSRNTLLALLNQGVVPVINENDTVATEEIRVGDNDNLSALVANLIDADLLVLLTNQEGLLTADPRRQPGAELVPEVSEAEIPTRLWETAGGSADGLGTGGMVTKLQAADLARRSGTAVVIAHGQAPDVLLRITAGEPVGTRFTATTSTLESRKRFLLAGRGAEGRVTVDEGASRALRRGGSLLPVGVLAVEGAFERGDPVCLFSPAGKEIARGLSNYSSDDLQRIRGARSSEIENILGFIYGDEVVHRDNMVVL